MERVLIVESTVLTVTMCANLSVCLNIFIMNEMLRIKKLASGERIHVYL